MKTRWDHKRCGGHVAHAGFAKKLCYQPDGSKEEAVAFADEIEKLAALPVPRLNGVGAIGAVARVPAVTWANRPYKAA